MPPDDDGVDKTPLATDQRRPNRIGDLFSNLISVPRPMKKLFDRFPIVIYAPNEPPQRAPKPSTLPSLYVFCTEDDEIASRPSFNPGCLKWQAFLKIAGIQHRLVSSNNHASPTGVLPFLLSSVCTSQNTRDAPLPIPSSKLVKFALENGSDINDPSNVRYEAYQSLLDHQIRNAWLHSLYLNSLNFDAVAKRLYVLPTSSNFLVRTIISRQLQSAAEAELLKSTSVIDVHDLYNEADKAFEALSIMLDENEWFFSGDVPTLFDASVFAYTHLLLDERMGWKEKRLVKTVVNRVNLVEHRDRLLVRYFGEC